MPSATLLIDRHYTALKPYRKGELNMYAVLKSDTGAVSYEEVTGNEIILRLHNQSSPIEVVALTEGKRAAAYPVGRICHISLEA